jgi:pimeloyl-ACP methyl ester carboxylesterase
MQIFHSHSLITWKVFMDKRTFTKSAIAAAVAFGASTLTIILVHGAFAGADGWTDVVKNLKSAGHPVICVANPLRGLKTDAAEVSAVIASITGPVILVGHSYGGMLISMAAVGKANVKGLVFVGAFTPDAGESVVDLAGKFPGSTLGDSLHAVPLVNGGKDLYIAQAKYHQQFCADVPKAAAAIMATTQRPIAEAAILEKADGAAWKEIPSWHIYGTADKNIPAAAMKWMAERAKAKASIAIPKASHVPHITHATAVANMIKAAAKA